MDPNSDAKQGLRRPRFFDRQHLKADDLSLEQAFIDERLRRHNKFLHGCGIVCGLDVEPELETDKEAAEGEADKTFQVIVTPGYALSPQGDEIFVPTEQVVCISFEENVAGSCLEVESNNTADSQYCYLAVRHLTEKHLPAPLMPEDCRPTQEWEYSRTLEHFEIACLDSATTGCEQLVRRNSVWNSSCCCEPTDQLKEHVDLSTCIEDVDDPWVALAFIELTSSGELKISYNNRIQLPALGGGRCCCKSQDTEREKRRLRSTGKMVASATSETDWEQYGGNSKTGIYVDVDASLMEFSRTPTYISTIQGYSRHWSTTGASSVYNASPNGFRIYVRWTNGDPLTPADAEKWGWRIHWYGVEA